MTRAERRAITARGAVMTLARQCARKAVEEDYRMRGIKLNTISYAQLLAEADAWLKAHPITIMQAKDLAKKLGYS